MENQWQNPWQGWMAESWDHRCNQLKVLVDLERHQWQEGLAGPTSDVNQCNSLQWKKLKLEVLDPLYIPMTGTESKDPVQGVPLLMRKKKSSLAFGSFWVKISKRRSGKKWFPVCDKCLKLKCRIHCNFLLHTAGLSRRQEEICFWFFIRQPASHSWIIRHIILILS